MHSRPCHQIEMNVTIWENQFDVLAVSKSIYTNNNIQKPTRIMASKKSICQSLNLE
jgi:ADP-glucose pyrophosphorylase